MQSCLVRMLALTVTAGGAAGARAHLDITSDVGAGGIAQVFAAGDVVPLTLYAAGDGEAPLFGVELDLAVATGDLRILSVSFHPALSQALGREDRLPAPRFHTVRVQPLAGLNRVLGMNGGSVAFATVELEVLTDVAFDSGLMVKAKGALVGKSLRSTVVFGAEEAGNRAGEGRIEIINVRAGAPGTGGDETTAPSWSLEQGDAILTITPAGGDEPVLLLTPDTEYEIHYTAGHSQVNGFDLIVTTTSAADAATDEQPAPPTFDTCWADSDLTPLPADESAGVHSRQVISADQLATSDTESLEVPAFNSGHVCNIVTGPSGTLVLDLRLYFTDPAEHHTIEMPASAEFAVE